jgi:hypothetical protein
MDFGVILPAAGSLVPAAGSLVLAMMGAFLTTRTLHLRHRLIWRASFIIIGLISAAANSYSARHQSETLNQIQMSITGGNSYAFIMPGSFDKAHLELMLRTEGNYTVYDLQVTIEDVNVLLAASKNLPQDISNAFTQSQNILKIGDMEPNQGKMQLYTEPECRTSELHDCVACTERTSK